MLLIFTGSLVLLGGRAGAQEQQVATRLSLRQALQIALKQSLEIQVSNLAVAEAQQDEAISRSALLPQVGLGVADRAERLNLDSTLGLRVPGLPHHTGPFQVFQAGPSFSIPMFDATLWRNWQASHQMAGAAAADERAVREQTVLLVISQYLTAQRARARSRAAQSRVDLAAALYNQAAQLEENGVGTHLDSVRANVELQSEKQRLLVSETQFKTSLYGLARLLHLDPRQVIDLEDEMSFEDTPEQLAQPTLERAYQERPEAQALVAQERAAQMEKRASRESRLPQLTLSGFWAYQGDSAPSSIPVYQYQANLQFPLFTGGRIRAEMSKADLRLKQLVRQQQQLTDQIALEVKTADAQLDSTRKQVEVANLGVNLSLQEVDEARSRFEEGVANNIEVISAQDALARANDDQIEALYQYNQARADLASAVGQIQELYVR